VKTVAFRYVAARSLAEALAALAEGGDEAKPLAGGQSLVPALNMRLVRPELLVDVNRAGLGGITAENGVVRVGATTRQAELERSAHAHPLVREALPYVGHVVTRNRGTVGGSLAHADGSAELPLCLVAAGGHVVVDGPNGRREIPGDELFVTHYLTTLTAGELLVESVWPAPREGEGFAFEELALRAGDYALSMVAVALRRDGDVAREVTIAAGAVIDRPTALAEAGRALEGERFTDEAVRTAAAAGAEAVDPADGIHASADYLRHLTAVLIERALARAWESAA